MEPAESQSLPANREQILRVAKRTASEEPSLALIPKELQALRIGYLNRVYTTLSTA